MIKTNQFKNIYKLFSFSLPICAGLLINMSANFSAMLMVAKLSTLEWAAAALAVPTFTAILASFSTIFYAIGILISHAKGQQKTPKDIGYLVKNGFWLALILLIPSSLILWNIDKVLIFFKQDPILVSFTTEYFHYGILALIPILIGSVISQLFIGIGRPKFMMLVSLCTLPLIILSSYGFILGRFGLPKLGLAGVTCATFLVHSLICSGILIYIARNKELKKYEIFSSFYLPNFSICKNIFRLGLPIGLQFGGELVALTLTTYLMGFFGTTALAASQIVSQYVMLVVVFMIGLSQGATILMSEAFAKSDIKLFKDYFTSSVTSVFILFSLVFLIFYLFPNQLMALYSHGHANAHLIDLVNKFFAIASILLLIDALRNVLSSGLKGLQDSKTPMKTGLICLWFVSLPMSYLCAFIFDGGPIGLRVGFISGYLIAVAYLWHKMQQKISFLQSNSISDQHLITNKM